MNTAFQPLEKKCLLTNPNSASYWLILEFRSVSRQGFSFTWVKVRQTMKGLLSCWRWPCGAGSLSLLLLPGMGWDLQSSSQTQKDKDSVFFWQRALVWEFIKQKKECELQDRSCGNKVLKNTQDIKADAGRDRTGEFGNEKWLWESTITYLHGGRQNEFC